MSVALSRFDELEHQFRKLRRAQVELSSDLSRFDELKTQYQEFYRTLDNLATGGPSCYDVRQIHNLVVRVLVSQPSMLSFDMLLDYVGSKGILKSRITEHLIVACRELPLLMDRIDSDSAAWFPELQAAALVQTMRIDLEVRLTNGKMAEIAIDFATLLDFLYDNIDRASITPHDWITNTFEAAGVDPTRVSHIQLYPASLGHFDARAVDLVEFLALEFGRLFQLGSFFLRLINESTQFSDKVPELYAWKDSNRFAMCSNAVRSLPITNATHEDFEPIQLFFRDPVVSLATMNSLDGSAHNRPYLTKVQGVSEAARETIRGVFFEKVEPAETYEVFYFLRRKPEMFDRLRLLSEEEKAELSHIDFAPYLSAMGQDVGSQDRRGFFGAQGLRKAVEIHSLRHICFGLVNVSLEPPFFSRR